MKKVLELRSITAGYNHNIILKNINLDVYEKDFLGIIGPNGGGKTTLLKVILGLIKPIKGQINFLYDSKDYKNFIGYLPQFKQFDENFPIKVIDVVLSGLMSNNTMGLFISKKNKKKAESLLEQTNILDMKNIPLEKLSGGQKQRVFLCRALISSPRMLILDEPNTFVDTNFSKNIFETLKELNKNTTIILVSHDLGIISSYVKNIACVNNTLHYHSSNMITEKVLESYCCPVEMITHGNVPHRVLKFHGDNQ